MFSLNKFFITPQSQAEFFKNGSKINNGVKVFITKIKILTQRILFTQKIIVYRA